MARNQTYKNALGEYVALSNEVFTTLYGAEFNNPRMAKDLVRLDLSGPSFALETLQGPEDGIMNDACRVARQNVQILNVKENQLSDISCIDKKQRDGTPEFKSLRILLASRNLLTVVSLTLPNLLELNLAHNELTEVPNTSGLPSLQKLILAHNKINDTLKKLEKNSRLNELYLHDNLFSWKPTEFDKQMQILATNHLNKLTVWPNPFAENFTEYQFLAVTRIETLTSLDGYGIDADLRSELRKLEEVMRAKNVLDYSIFDIKVQEREGFKGVVQQQESEYVDLARIPTLKSLLSLLSKPLDHPNQLIKYIYNFKTQVGYLWGARYSDRVKVMEIRDADELELKTMEFSNKMQQLLLRFDSAQDALVESLVRLCASGNTRLSQECAILLSQWVDALPFELQQNLQRLASPLFRELRVRILPGMQSLKDDPRECLELHQGRIDNHSLQEKYENGFFGSIEAIAESAEILGALAKFGRPGFQKQSQLGRSAVLQPLLAVICRTPREILGKDLPRDAKQTYEGFTAFHGAEMPESDCVSGPTAGFIDMCYGRCVKRNLGGFVVRTKSPGILEAQFVHETSDALRGMRTPQEGSTLYVMPAVAMDKAPYQEPGTGIKEVMTWSVWKNALDVLVVATASPHNARLCIRQFNIHEVVIQHNEKVFTESFLNVTHQAGPAFTSLMMLAANLCKGSSAASQMTRDKFAAAKFHKSCWDRVRRRLTEGGGQLARTRLKQADPGFTTTVASLVQVIFQMALGTGGEAIVLDMVDGMDDVFNMMLDVAADTDVPDPLLLSASLETLYMFLSHEKTRMKKMNGQTLIEKVLSRLHEMAILLPYLRGPKLNDANNNKYQDLWKMCEKKYGADKHLQERMPALFDEAESGAYGDWRDRCPPLKDLVNPLMHRVLLDIVRLIEMFSDQARAADDSTGEFKRVSEMMDLNDREKLLIGPSEGLVLVPDYDVKIEVLRVIQHVLESSPGQFQTQEMGWLLRYLESTGIGVGRQEDFLMEVLKLNCLLINDPGSTGFKFRQQFAKQAIRQAYEMLKANTLRDVHGAKDEETSKIALSLQIVSLLRICSLPLSGGLRQFLRRADFMIILKDVLKAEDPKGQSGIREPLLRTWTGRDMREVLLPLVTLNDLEVTGLGRYRAMNRMADVLQGRSDHILLPGNKLRPNTSTDENGMWPGLQGMKSALQIDDDYFHSDREVQQREFIFSSGLDGLLKYAERVFTTTDAYVQINTDAKTQVKAISVESQRTVLEEYWDTYTKGPKKRAVKQEVKVEDLEPKESVLEEFITSRVTCTNERLIKKTKLSVKIFDEKRGSTLKIIAQLLKTHVEDNQKLYTRWHRDEYFKKLEGVENAYWTSNGKLEEYSEIKKRNIKFHKMRQSSSMTLETLDVQGQEAQRSLKKLLLSKGTGVRQDVMKESYKWADTVWKTGNEPDFMNPYVSEGLVDFLADHGCTVYDPGTRTKEDVEIHMDFKYGNDPTRVRNVARLYLEFKDPESLFHCLKDLKKNTRMSIIMLRNRFKSPQALGQRHIQAYVEVVANQSKFVCELLMVINEEMAGQPWMTLKNIREQLTKVLKEDCKVPQNKLEEVCEFIMYEMTSPSIRDDDVVYLQTAADENQYLVVQGQAVAAADGDLSQRNLFFIERNCGYGKVQEAGSTNTYEDYGPVKTGDIIRLRNYYTHCYLDASISNHGIRCRYNDASGEASNFHFVIEEAPETAVEEGGLLGLAAFAASDQAIVPASKDIQDARRKAAAHKHKMPARNLHHDTAICFKVYGSSSPIRRVTVKAPESWGATFQMLKAAPRLPDDVCDPQVFVAKREGALHHFLNAPSLKAAEMTAKSISGEKTAEQAQNDLLLEAYMAPTLPFQAPQEGGVFRRNPPSFEDIASRQVHNAVLSTHRLSQHLHEDDEEDEGDAILQRDRKDVLQDKESEAKVADLPPMTVAAILRCVYALLEVPAFPEARISAIDEVLGTIEDFGHNAKLCRLLVLSITASTNAEKKFVSKGSICTAWIATKTLRTLSAAFKRMPALSLPAADRKEKLNLPDRGKAEHEEKAVSGQFDRQRLGVLKTYSSYIAAVLAPPLLHRLATASQRPMTKSEVTLLVELCSAVYAITRGYYSNELRCRMANKALENDNGGSPKGGGAAAIMGADDAGLLATLEADAEIVVARTEGVVAEMQDDMAGLGENLGFTEKDRNSKNCIRGEMEAKIFSSLVPPEVIRVLVHALLHGMRMEALAYAQQRNIANETHECVKLTSALVQSSIHALAICMHGCEGSEETSCDYNVCEAISQALSLGAQFVPRARVTQLMLEWHCEKHRESVDKMLESPEVYFASDILGDTIYLQPQSTERTFMIGYAWHAVGTFEKPAKEVHRRLVVITSRLNLIILKVEDLDDGKVPSQDDMQVVAYRNLARVQRICSHSRMRQFLGLLWDEGAPDAFCEALIFESSFRRRDFHEGMRLVHRFRPRVEELDPDVIDYEAPNHPLEPGNVNGRIPETFLKNSMLLTLRLTCKPMENPRSEAQLVTVAFVRSTSMFGVGQPSIAALAMTREAIAIINIRSFLKYWMSSEDPQSPELPRSSEGDDDSDDDNDGIPDSVPGDPTDMDDFADQMEKPDRGIWQIRALSGVWFLADQDPMVAMQFKKKEEITFFSDGDRQRFRQHLACVLKLGDDDGKNDEKAQTEQGKLWRVQPTGKTDLGTVAKEVREVEVQIAKHVDHVKKMAQLALGNG